MTPDDDASQSGYDEGLAGGPGAPTPLWNLEVRSGGLGGEQSLNLNRASLESQSATFNSS